MQSYFRRAALGLTLLLTHKEVFLQVPVYVDEGALANMEPIWLEKIRRSLTLIEHISPLVVQRIRRHTRGIWVNSVTGPDYLPDGRLIRILGPTLHGHSTVSLALTLTHEATHARISARGIPYIASERMRHEHACVRAEARLATRLPGGTSLAADVIQKLDTPWWTPEQRKERDLESIDRLTLPDWLRDRLRKRVKGRDYE